MDGVADELLISAASQMSGAGRRMFLAAVCLKHCEGNTRRAEYRFGWGRETISQGLEEQKLHHEELATRKKKHREDKNPQLEQVQSHRALLVVVATQVERRATDLLGSGASMCLANDVGRQAFESASLGSQLRRRSRCDQR